MSSKNSQSTISINCCIFVNEVKRMHKHHKWVWYKSSMHYGQRIIVAVRLSCPLNDRWNRVIKNTRILTFTGNLTDLPPLSMVRPESSWWWAFFVTLGLLCVVAKPIRASAALNSSFLFIVTFVVFTVRIDKVNGVLQSGNYLNCTKFWLYVAENNFVPLEIRALVASMPWAATQTTVSF